MNWLDWRALGQRFTSDEDVIAFDCIADVQLRFIMKRTDTIISPLFCQ